MRMVYPYLQLAYLTAQANLDCLASPPSMSAPPHTAAASAPSPESASTSAAAPDSSAAHEALLAEREAAIASAVSQLRSAPDALESVDADGGFDVDGVSYLLRRLAEANPEEKTINSLLYWMLDMFYKVTGRR